MIKVPRRAEGRWCWLPVAGPADGVYELVDPDGVGRGHWWPQQAGFPVGMVGLLNGLAEQLNTHDRTSG